MRTILVDDEALALERLQVFFAASPEAHVVATARDGKEAAEAIARLDAELVLLDLQMPEQDGLSLAASLPHQDPPEVIFITALTHYGPEAFAFNAADYLLKPVTPDRLRQAVQRAERRHRLRRAGPGERSRAERPTDGPWVRTGARPLLDRRPGA